MSDSNRYADYFTRVGTPVRRRPDRDDREKKIHAVFGLIGVLAGAGAAYVAWDRADSVALAIFAFFAANYFVGRGVGDLVTDDQKVKRLFFFALPVIIDSALIYVTQQWWHTMWLSVLAGVLVGAAVWAPVAVILFADITAEEQADTQQRMADAKGS